MIFPYWYKVLDSTTLTVEDNVIIWDQATLSVFVLPIFGDCLGSDGSNVGVLTIDTSSNGCPVEGPNNFTITDTNTSQPTFSWDLVLNAERYALWLINVDAQQNVFAYYIDDLKYIPTEILEDGVQYKATVGVIKTGCITQISESQEFKIDLSQ